MTGLRARAHTHTHTHTHTNHIVLVPLDQRTVLPRRLGSQKISGPNSAGHFGPCAMYARGPPRLEERLMVRRDGGPGSVSDLIVVVSDLIVVVVRAATALSPMVMLPSTPCCTLGGGEWMERMDGKREGVAIVSIAAETHTHSYAAQHSFPVPAG